MASFGAIAAISAGLGIGVAASKKTTTPLGVLTGITPDIDLPELPEVPGITDGIDKGAIDKARAAERDRLAGRRGRASTIKSKAKGILAAETTGNLLGS